MKGTKRRTDSFMDFLLCLIPHYLKRGIKIQCVQIESDSEIIKHLAGNQTDRKATFGVTAEMLGIKLKHIHTYLPRHNGKVERSCREDHKRFYRYHTFYSFKDFSK